MTNKETMTGEGRAYDAGDLIEYFAEALGMCEETLQAGLNAGWEIDAVTVHDDGGGFIDASHFFAGEPRAQGIEMRLDPGNSGEVFSYHARLGSRRRWLVVEGYGPMPTPEEAREAYLEAYAENYPKKRKKGE